MVILGSPRYHFGITLVSPLPSAKVIPPGGGGVTPEPRRQALLPPRSLLTPAVAAILTPARLELWEPVIGREVHAQRDIELTDGVARVARLCGAIWTRLTIAGRRNILSGSPLELRGLGKV